MAKRFIDTDVFKKQFLRELKPAFKLFWFYITTDCNHAGICECDFDVAAIRTGQKIDPAAARKLFREKIIELDGGSKWFIPSFIEFQYGQLSEKNRAHTHVIAILRKYGLVDEFLHLTKEGPSKPLTSPLQGAKDMDKEKEKEKEEEKQREKEFDEAEKTLTHPFSINFDFVWQQWRSFKKDEFKFVYKSLETEQIALNELIKLSEAQESVAIEIVMKSIANGWKGFFALKNKSNATHQQPTSSIKQQNNNSFIERAFLKHSAVAAAGRTEDRAA
jgi:hypothetical protein